MVWRKAPFGKGEYDDRHYVWDPFKQKIVRRETMGGRKFETKEFKTMEHPLPSNVGKRSRSGVISDYYKAVKNRKVAGLLGNAPEGVKMNVDRVLRNRKSFRYRSRKMRRNKKRVRFRRKRGRSRRFKRRKGGFRRKVKAILRQSPWIPTYTHKEKQVQNLAVVSLAQQCAYSYISVGTRTTLNSILDDAFIVWKDGFATTEARDPIVEYGNYKMSIQYRGHVEYRNNSPFDCKMRLYLVRVRGNHTMTPNAIIADMFEELTGQAGAGANVLPAYFLEDCKEWHRLFRVVKKKFVFLRPGEGGKLYFKQKPFFYDYTESTVESSLYSAKYTYHIIIRLQGTVAHDKVQLQEVGISSAQVDFTTYNAYRIGADDVKQRKIAQHSNLIAFTNEPVQWNVDVAQEEE